MPSAMLPVCLRIDSGAFASSHRTLVVHATIAAAIPGLPCFLLVSIQAPGRRPSERPWSFGPHDTKHRRAVRTTRDHLWPLVRESAVAPSLAERLSFVKGCSARSRNWQYPWLLGR